MRKFRNGGRTLDWLGKQLDVDDQRWGFGGDKVVEVRLEKTMWPKGGSGGRWRCPPTPPWLLKGPRQQREKTAGARIEATD